LLSYEVVLRMLLSDHINVTSKENPENNKRDQLKDKHNLVKTRTQSSAYIVLFSSSAKQASLLLNVRLESVP